MELSTELIFGGIWSSPGLDTKTRIMICVISDTATGRIGVLPEHIRMAMNEGWTEDELTEALLQLVGYVGAPFVRDAMKGGGARVRRSPARPRAETAAFTAAAHHSSGSLASRTTSCVSFRCASM